MNRITLIGRLTRDPEMKYLQTGDAVTSFSIAVERPFRNQQGEREVDFIDIVTWRKLAENCADYLAKGLLVAVDGRLQIRTYMAKDGTNRKATEVVANQVKFLEWKDKKEAAADVPF